MSYLDFSIVSPLPGADGRPLPVPASWVPFPSVGEERLYVSPSVDEGALPARFIQPLLCRERGHPTPGVGYIGVDSRVWMDERHTGEPTPSPGAPRRSWSNPNSVHPAPGSPSRSCCIPSGFPRRPAPHGTGMDTRALRCGWPSSTRIAADGTCCAAWMKPPSFTRPRNGGWGFPESPPTGALADRGGPWRGDGRGGRGGGARRTSGLVRDSPRP
ncbi:hypothetical protein ACN28S_12855 [Cystobacter fuscus]